MFWVFAGEQACEYVRERGWGIMLALGLMMFSKLVMADVDKAIDVRKMDYDT